MKKNLYITPELTLVSTSLADVLTLSARDLCDFENVDRVIYGRKVN